MTDMALRCRMRGDTGAGLNAGTDVKVPLISKVAYGMGMWAATSAGCLWVIS